MPLSALPYFFIHWLVLDILWYVSSLTRLICGAAKKEKNFQFPTLNIFKNIFIGRSYRYNLIWEVQNLRNRKRIFFLLIDRSTLVQTGLQRKQRRDKLFPMGRFLPFVVLRPKVVTR